MTPSPPSSPSSATPSNPNHNPSPVLSPNPNLAVSIAVATAASSSDHLTPLAALPAPNAPHPIPSASTRRIPPPCWTNDETLALIESYRDKWYSLNRGSLRAAHWDEVAAAVSARSRHIPGSTTKTPVQCRHKVEKLRKRYRSEKQRSLSHDPRGPPSSPWIFFPHIHSMEQQPTLDHHHHRLSEDSGDDEDLDDDHDQFLLRPPMQPNGIGGLKFKIPKAVRSRAVVGSGTAAIAAAAIPRGIPSPSPNPSLEMRRRMEERRRKDKDSALGEDSMGEVVRALRALGDGYVRTEQMKMEMAREMERTRMEAELRRTEMVLDAQRRIVDAVVGELVVGRKKRKRAKIAAAVAAAAAAAAAD